MKRLIIIILSITAIVTSCYNNGNGTHNILCSCYIFSTAGKTPHYYIEVKKSGVISLYYGSEIDSIYYYLSKGSDIPLDSKQLLQYGRDSLPLQNGDSILTKSIPKDELILIKSEIKKLERKKEEHIFARSKDNPEKIVQLVKKGLTQNCIVLTTTEGQYYFWENEGSQAENNIIKIIKENSPVPIILKYEFE